MGITGLVLPIFLPILAGILVFFLKNAKVRNLFVGSIVVINAILIFAVVFGDEVSVELFRLTQTVPVLFKVDAVAKIFASLIAIMWVASAIFAFEYMNHEEAKERYYGFFLITLGMLNGVSLAGNLVTFYMLFELMTLASMPLVLHTLKKDAIHAALKYLFYSIFGAMLGLLGIFFMFQYTTTIEFTVGGTLDVTKLAGNEGFFLFITFIALVGFGAKAGLFPLHGWLPTAHPVAPAPASAVLSGIIAKAGVIAMVRIIFYIVGPDFLRGTWVQYTLISLGLLTVFMGSMLAYKEDLFKKRLAYSTVSQVSYIVVGLVMLTADGFIGAILHIIAHAFIKDALFLTAAAIIYKTGKTRVSELRGIGKEMPITMWCFTLVSIALIGIPPTSAFVSKWFLATGSLATGIPVLSWLSPVILLVSALLTAGYLLPITINGFFPGHDFNYKKLKKYEPNWLMTVPVIVLTAGAVLIGMFPTQLIAYIREIITTIL